MATANTLLELDGVSKRYRTGSSEVAALADVSLAVARGEFVVVLGPSGSGKSTLLYLAAGLEQPSDGVVRLDGRPVSELSQRELAQLRRTRIGFVFQMFHLVRGLTALENVALPLRFGGHTAKTADAIAANLLADVGLERRLRHYPSQLSGGEMQRVGLARALGPCPALLLADEPTGNLDSTNGDQLIALIRRIASKQHGAVVLVTHDEQAIRPGDRVVRLTDGTIDAIRPSARVA